MSVACLWLGLGPQWLWRSTAGAHRDRAKLANKGRHAKQVIRHRYEQERLRCVRSV